MAAHENQARVDAGFGESLSDDPRRVPQDPTTVTCSRPQLVPTKVGPDLNGGEPQPGDRFRYTMPCASSQLQSRSSSLIRHPSDWLILLPGRVEFSRMERLPPVERSAAPPVEFTFEGTASPELGTYRHCESAV